MSVQKGGGLARAQYLGRMANRAKHVSGDIERCRAALHKALDRVERLIDDEDKNMQLRAVHALSQTISAFVKVLGVGEIEGRLAELELAEEARAAEGHRQAS